MFRPACNRVRTGQNTPRITVVLYVMFRPAWNRVRTGQNTPRITVVLYVMFRPACNRVRTGQNTPRITVVLCFMFRPACSGVLTRAYKGVLLLHASDGADGMAHELTALRHKVLQTRRVVVQ